MRLLVATKKGAFTLTPKDSGRRSWSLSGPILFGNVIYHCVQDPRDPKRILIAGSAGGGGFGLLGGGGNLRPCAVSACSMASASAGLAR